MAIFEVSWEVCNKVGGIYTVLSSKASHAVSIYGDDYVLVGACEKKEDFKQLPTPNHLKKVFERLAERGVHCEYGRWNIAGQPQVILVDIAHFSRGYEAKGILWEQYAIDSLGTDYFDYDKPVIWSWCVGMLIDEFQRQTQDTQTIGHFHEWMSGAGALYLKFYNKHVSTVFTTHATVLGRALAERSDEMYKQLDRFNPDEEAKRLQLVAKFQTERAAAHNAHVFTTVSEITAKEATLLLGKKPDILTFNGLDFTTLPSADQLSEVRSKSRARLLELITAFFYPHVGMDLDKVTIVAVFGRNEFHVKGIDILSKSLTLLNDRLKQDDAERTVICFYFIPSGAHGVRQELIESKAKIEDLKTTIDTRKEVLYFWILHKLLENKSLDIPSLFGDIQEDARNIGMPYPLHCTHYLHNEQDAIMGSFNSFKNTVEDKVKVIYYPIYLAGNDGLLNLAYGEALSAIDLGIFPSFYEPWGYTPHEAAAYHIPAVTSNTSGFGRFIDALPNKEGIHILDRFNQTPSEIAEQLSDYLHHFIHLSDDEHHNLSENARSLAEHAEWRLFYKHYQDAYEQAKLSLDKNSNETLDKTS